MSFLNLYSNDINKLKGTFYSKCCELQSTNSAFPPKFERTTVVVRIGRGVDKWQPAVPLHTTLLSLPVSVNCVNVWMYLTISY